MTFPADFLDLLEDETKALLYLATIMPDGSPQLTPVWFSIDGEDVLINTNEGRVKDKNMKARRQVAMVVQDPKIQTRYLGMRGEIVGYTREGADEHINQLCLKYNSRPWTYRPSQRRIIYRIRAHHFDLHYD
jgi:PPOX class probable F420-dependent enzyme